MSFQETHFKNVSQIAKKTDLGTKIAKLEERKKSKVVIYSPLWRGKFPGDVKQTHFNAGCCLWQRSALATGADCAVCTPVLPVATWSHMPSTWRTSAAQRGTKPLGVLMKRRDRALMKRRDRAPEQLQQRLKLGSSCSPQPASLGRTSERKPTPALFAT